MFDKPEMQNKTTSASAIGGNTVLFWQEYGDVCVNSTNMKMIPMAQLDESDVFNR